MTRLTDPQYLRGTQYKTSGNLSARANLHERFSDSPRPWQHWVFDQFSSLPETARVLEVGCGPGQLWRQNAARIPARWQLTLTDFSPGMVEEARGAVHHPGTRFEVCDAQTLPFEDGAFDAVIANHMLYHVPDRPRALAGFARVLGAGGQLFAGTNGAAHLLEISQLQARFSAAQGLPIRALPFDDGRFDLEHGGDELCAFFGQVTLRPYVNRLRVTDADSLAAYMLSTAAADAASLRPVLVAFIQAEIERKCPIEIRTSTGILVARQ